MKRAVAHAQRGPKQTPGIGTFTWALGKFAGAARFRDTALLWCEEHRLSATSLALDVHSLTLDVSLAGRAQVTHSPRFPSISYIRGMRAKPCALITPSGPAYRVFPPALSGAFAGFFPDCVPVPPGFVVGLSTWFAFPGCAESV